MNTSLLLKNLLRLKSAFRGHVLRPVHRSTILECKDSKPESESQRLLEEAATFEDEKPKSSEDIWATSPYPKGATSRNQALQSLRPRVDPRETSIILFPGQGTQFVGMGKDLLKFPTVKDMFEEASEILNYKLLKLCLEGPQEKLDKTAYAQPAILVCSLAALERLKEERPSAVENCVATAGFSLGEIAALVLGDVISFRKAVKLVKIRGEAMQLAAEMIPGAMVTVLYGPDSRLGDACNKARDFASSSGIENAYCGVANYLFPHCKIVAGHELAIKYLEDNRSEFKLKRLKRLPVSGAFHTPLMTPALEVFRAAFLKMPLRDPVLAIHSNVDGKYYTSVDHVKRRLVRQMVAPVKWEQTLHILYERPPDMPYPRTYECGPGNTLSTILKMVNAKAHEDCYNVRC